MFAALLQLPCGLQADLPWRFAMQSKLRLSFRVTWVCAGVMARVHRQVPDTTPAEKAGFFGSPLMQPPPVDAAEDETPAAARQRFQSELEFVQSLANPDYLHHLAQNLYLTTSRFQRVLGLFAILAPICRTVCTSYFRTACACSSCAWATTILSLR